MYNKYDGLYKIYNLEFSDTTYQLDDEEKMIKDFMDNYELTLSDDIKILYNKFITIMISLFNNSNKLLFNEKGRINYNTGIY